MRKRLEPLFGADFTQVRIHDDARANEAASHAHARAVTIGNHVYFRRREYRPDDPDGAHLLAHELTHTIHQRGAAGERPDSTGADPVREAGLERDADDTASRVLAGQLVHVPAGLGLTHEGAARPQRKVDLNDFESGEFSIAELKAYLKAVTDAGEIEDNNDSDDKARGIVKEWLKDTGTFLLDPMAKVLLIKEMQSGYTGNDDERAILNLLVKSSHDDVEAIFSEGGVDPKDLDSDFHWAEEKELRAFYDEHFIGGREAALEGKRAIGPERFQTLKSPYSAAVLRRLIAQKRLRIERTIRDVSRDRPEENKDWQSQVMARDDADAIYRELLNLTLDEQARATQDMAADRSRRESEAQVLSDKIATGLDSGHIDRMKRQREVVRAEITMLDLVMQRVFRRVATNAPKDPADFQKQTTKLMPEQEKAAQEAITPVTRAEAWAEAGEGKPVTPKFTETLKGETTTYGEKVAARIPTLIQERWDERAKGRGPAEHAKEKDLRPMSVLEAVANQSRKEVNLVFGSFLTKERMEKFQFKAEKRDRAGRVTSPGNLGDMWAREEQNRKDDKDHLARAAEFWLFYLIQNDKKAQKGRTMISTINYAHNAAPKFDREVQPLNDEARIIRGAGDPFLKTHAQELFEIGRAWKAVHNAGDVFAQRFKGATPIEERRTLWELYLIFIHEYLHALAHEDYDDYAHSLGGENTTEGSTLIEGVDSLLTEIAWTSAKARAVLPEVREQVEAEAFKSGDIYDPTLLPQPTVGRYPVYSQAVRLVSIVGIRNLYAAYFQGRLDLIGGKKVQQP